MPAARTKVRLGESLRYEAFFELYPDMPADPESASDLVYTEYITRSELGETPSHEEYYDRFPQLRQELERQFQLIELLDGDNSLVPASEPQATTPDSASTRYRIPQLHTKGGVGQVMRATDTEIGREVAIKEIQPSCNGIDEVQERFLREAEITARLEHPGVVPVFGIGGIGRNQLGHPFYAMRMVLGQSLSDAIQEFHSREARASFDSTDFNKLLRRFLSVCEIVVFAHSRGNIHRDIKPQNILLGPYGETLVVDWGLAKVIAANTTDWNKTNESNEHATPRQADDTVNWSVDLTRSKGTLIGTPAFMSPEQARGETPAIEPASDVYSLGANTAYSPDRSKSFC